MNRREVSGPTALVPGRSGRSGPRQAWDLPAVSAANQSGLLSKSTYINTSNSEVPRQSQRALGQQLSF